jgi:hypothetical protein
VLPSKLAHAATLRNCVPEIIGSNPVGIKPILTEVYGSSQSLQAILGDFSVCGIHSVFYPMGSSEVKQQEREADNLYSSSAEVRIDGSINPLPHANPWDFVN